MRGEAEPGVASAVTMLGVEPATGDCSGGWPYLVRRDAPVEPSECPLHIAKGIQRIAGAQLIAAAPELSAMLLRLLTAPAATAHDLDARSRAAVDAAWALLVRIAPHLEIGP